MYPLARRGPVPFNTTSIIYVTLQTSSDSTELMRDSFYLRDIGACPRFPSIRSVFAVMCCAPVSI